MKSENLTVVLERIALSTSHNMKFLSNEIVIPSYTSLPISEKISPTEVCPTDRGSHYFYAGRSALYAIDLALLSARKAAASITSILDLPCGQGRVARWLKARFPHAKLICSDLDASGVQFCIDTFGAEGHIATQNFEDLHFEMKFDLIWVGSLFSHLDGKDWSSLFVALSRALNPGGILVFTHEGTVGVQLIENGRLDGLSQKGADELISDYKLNGFGFANYMHLPHEKYGRAAAKSSWVGSFLEQFSEMRPILQTEAAWDSLQDVVACQKYVLFEETPSVTQYERGNLYALWQGDGIKDEMTWWSDLFDGIIGAPSSVVDGVVRQMRARLAPGRPLPNYIRELLDKSTDITVPLRILDAGAGAFTQIGHTWPGHDVEVIAVDALAMHYNKLLNDYSLTAPNPTIHGEFELMNRQFEKDYFDFAWTQNSLDHSYNPPQGLRNLIHVVKPGGYIGVLIFEDEGKRENYQGMHQWNFGRRGQDILLSSSKGYEEMIGSLVNDIADIVDVRYVTYFNDHDGGGIETITKEQHDDIFKRNPETYVWLHFLLKKHTD